MADANIDASALKLARAVDKLEGAVAAMLERMGDPVLVRRELAAMINDRDKLAQQLDGALARENELQLLADEASQAISGAISHVRHLIAQDAQAE